MIFQNPINNIPAHSKTTEELVTKRFSLSNGTKSSIVDLFSIKFNTVLRKLKPLLNH
jgi:hypothetical protein